MDVLIRECAISELENASNIHELLAEYAEESSISGLPVPAAKVETYRHLEKTGALRVVGAFIDDKIIGYITILSTILPHYSTLVSVCESFFVLKEQRKTGAGMKLLREAESHAEKIGSPGILVSTPLGGVLAEVLPRLGYIETNRVFFRKFENE